MSQNNHPYQGIWFSVLVPAESESDQVQANIVLRHIRSVENLKAVVHQACYSKVDEFMCLVVRAETSSHNLEGTIQAVLDRTANHCINICHRSAISTLQESMTHLEFSPIKFVEEPDIQWL